MPSRLHSQTVARPLATKVPRQRGKSLVRSLSSSYLPDEGLTRSEKSTIAPEKGFVEWVASELRDNCYCCKVKFKMFRRKHHCRKCGEVVCAPCSHEFMLILGFDQPVRVCLLCASTERDTKENSYSQSVKTIDSDDEDDEFSRRLTRSESTESFRTESFRAGWIENSLQNECSICKSTFTMFRRKHHCRRCGELVCHPCSPHTGVVKGYSGQVRICECCHQLSVRKKSERGLLRAQPQKLRTAGSSSRFFMY